MVWKVLVVSDTVQLIWLPVTGCPLGDFFLNVTGCRMVSLNSRYWLVFGFSGCGGCSEGMVTLVEHEARRSLCVGGWRALPQNGVNEQGRGRT